MKPANIAFFLAMVAIVILTVSGIQATIIDYPWQADAHKSSAYNIGHFIGYYGRLMVYLYILCYIVWERASGKNRQQQEKDDL